MTTGGVIETLYTGKKMEEKKTKKQKKQMFLFVFDRTCLRTPSGNSLLLWQHITEDKA